MKRYEFCYEFDDEHQDAVGAAMRESPEGKYVLFKDVATELESLRAFKRSVDEALNSGDGSYRP